MEMQLSPPAVVANGTSSAGRSASPHNKRRTRASSTERPSTSSSSGSDSGSDGRRTQPKMVIMAQPHEQEDLTTREHHAYEEVLVRQVLSKRMAAWAQKYTIDEHGFFRNWQRRWFMQVGPVLTYHKQVNGEAVRHINLAGCRIIRKPSPKMDHPEATERRRDLVVVFDHGTKRLLMRFDDELDRDEWALHLSVLQQYYASCA